MDKRPILKTPNKDPAKEIANGPKQSSSVNVSQLMGTYSTKKTARQVL
jgi:hypothetical protein